jgi:hypothetical protein
LRKEKKGDGALQEKSGESEGDAEWPSGRLAGRVLSKALRL